MQIRKLLTVGALWAASLCLTSTSLQASVFGSNGCYDECAVDCGYDCNYNSCDTINGYFDISTGYRWDELKQKFSTRISGTDTIAIKDHLKTDGLSTWVLGGKGLVSYDNWYIRGEGYYGWTYSGKVKDTGISFDSPFHEGRKIHNGHTSEFSIGGGYMFHFPDCYGNCWGIGPVAGWSFDEMHLKFKHHNREHDLCDSFDPTFPIVDSNGIQHKSRWSGPWLGFDVQFRKCQLQINAGYEYHWAHWNAKGKFCGEDGTFFHTNFKANDASGNVGYLDAKWILCDNWTAGIGFKYEAFDASKGKHKHLEELGIDFKHARSEWRSARVTLDLGYAF